MDSFVNLNEEVEYNYNLLNDIDKAVKCYLKHIENNSNIHIVVDCDTDGQTSAAMIYNYTKLITSNCRLSYSIHSSKEHGLSKDIEISEDVNLLIIPDASSNDVEQCKELHEKGIDILILDHHECDIKNPYAIVVNNQMCDYPNKQLCGAAIVYKFLQAVDEESWNDFAGNFIDLVSLGLIGDNMDVKSPETRFLIDKGIKKIRNKLYKAFIEKQSYSLGGNFTSKDIQFYIVPLINGMIRAGDSDEKDLLFRGFIETDEVFKYKKRGVVEEIDEDIYTRVARLCANAKSRQNRVKDKSLIEIYEDIEKKEFNKNQIIFANVTEILDQTMTGVTAIKVAEHYGKPCLLFRKDKDNDNLYGGSGRNIDNSPIKDLKGFLNELNLFDWVNGHPNAFGFKINKNNISKAIKLVNEKLKDIEFAQCIEADFILSSDYLNIGLIKDIDDLKYFYGSGFSEPIIVVEDIQVNKDEFELMGKDNTSWKITTDNNIAIVKFKVDENDPLIKSFEENNTVNITVVGRVNINNFKGILTSQIIVLDYVVN